MTIFFITYALAKVGGLERILTDKMNYLADKYHYKIFLITTAQSNHPIVFGLSHNVTHIDLNIPYHQVYQKPLPLRLFIWHKMDQEFCHQIQLLIDEYQPDVISVLNWKAGLLCNFSNKTKVIVESHCAKSYSGINNGIQKSCLNRLLTKKLWEKEIVKIEKYCSTLVTLTEGDAKEWNCKEKICVIPNMIHISPTTKTTYSETSVIAAGRICYQKGFDLLVRSWQIVHSKHPDWKLKIYGEGEDQNKLLRTIYHHQLQDCIMIYKPVLNIYDEYKNNSIFVCPSRYEGFGLVIAEAMSCGLPAVSFDCPYGPKDIITDGEDGFLIPLGDYQTFAEKIIYLIEHPEERQRMGQKGITSTKRFSPDKIMPQWINLFHQLVKTNNYIDL